MTCLSFWLQMSEPITHIDTDNYMTIHPKGTSYFDSTTHAKSANSMAASGHWEGHFYPFWHRWS